jgi:ABC-type multidrug transport system fused ATPase/permease subunit
MVWPPRSQKLRHHLPPWLVLGREIMQVILSYPLWLVLSILSTILHAALEPSLAWMGKSFVDDLQKQNTALEGSLMGYALRFGGVIVGLAVIKFGNQIFNKIYESRLIIVLQRRYLERRRKAREAQDVSRLLYDTEQAKKGLDIIYKDSWSIVAQMVSVIVWQLSLAPQWLPALVLTVVPPMIIVLLFGKWIQQASLETLELQGQIAGSTGRDRQLQLFRHQEAFLRYGVRLEALKAGAEVMMDLLTWFGLLLLAILALVVHISVLPQDITSGDLALFAVNLNLLSKPLGSIVKVYNKGRESYPAVLRVLQPQLWGGIHG